MFRKIISRFLPPAKLSASPEEAALQKTQAGTLAVGDVIIQHKEHKGWCAIKVLALDSYPNRESTAHCLTYDWSPEEPTLATVTALAVRVWHAPIGVQAFAQGWLHLGNQPVTRNECEGFIDFLRLTDFPRYLEFTGQVLEDVVSRANALYREACRLGDEGRRIDAIRLYDEVIMMFPPFYEAIDNRAFTYMELGDYQRAFAGFDMSLDVHPHGFAAFFSRGECLMRLGQLEKAQAVFEEGLTRFPEQRETLERFLQAVRGAKGAK